jgi:hypothetical protein
MSGYSEAKSGVPGAITEANALMTTARALSAALAKHGIKLDVPAPARTTTESVR